MRTIGRVGKIRTLRALSGALSVRSAFKDTWRQTYKLEGRGDTWGHLSVFYLLLILTRFPTPYFLPRSYPKFAIVPLRKRIIS